MIEPYYWPEERERPILSTATNPELRQVLNKGTSQTVIAIEAVNAQLKLWKDTVEKQAANTITCRLSGVDIAKLAFRGYLGENVEEDAAVIKKVVESPENANELSELKKGIWSWSKLPYAVRRVGSSLIDNSDDESEKGPHKRTKVLENDELVDDVDECLEVFVSWPNFQGRFDCMSGGLLAGLDWSNIFVAGGLVLGALLTPDIPPTASVPTSERLYLNQPLEWISSDIDLYIYGLDVEAANEKIKHIAEVYQSNLGSVDAPFLVVRNSQTITLYSEWPKRRVQIVLKLVKSPRDVLLNFDLDSCALGWDGKEVWMLPRFVRALETGTNVFTMDLVNGHYLGDRKATRDKRVFKYAKRGYGIRIIPLYIGYLSSYQSTIPERRPSQPPLSLSLIAEQARTWTREVVNRYVQTAEGFLTYHWPVGRWPRFKAKRVTRVLARDVRRSSSCLTGFGLLMRHVALIYEHIFAEDAYNNNGYDDTPAYEWDDKFTKIGFPVVKRVSYAAPLTKFLSGERFIYPYIHHRRIRQICQRPCHKCTAGVRLDEDKMAKVKSLPLRLIGNNNNYGVVLALWQLNNILNWQMVDRRIDEIREVSSERDESLAFVRWVGRQPCQYTTDVNGIFFVQHYIG
ncbi:hypothetical protein DFJ43DRAFT_1077989 [Lentinula guzmanii]|uniref:Uncharacterized protein n=1 Tax=Lentinula guzmanii TaxID=2804957 RepID=A0AA38MZ31_9AGAR|nr:hypothetical protein DFJ43DRAFT_1077989 [Lentinula guzmanii]